MFKNVYSTLILGSLFLLLPVLTNAQLQYSLKYDAASEQWSAYLKNTVQMTPNSTVRLTSGQITLVVSNGFELVDLEAVSEIGGWALNSIVKSPIENPNYDYLSMGFVTGLDFSLNTDEEILLFTFRTSGDCPEEIYLISNNDPFARPNSVSTNPLNDARMFNFTENMRLYEYEANYKPCDAFCGPCDPTQFEEAVSSTRFEFSESFNIYPNPTNGLVNIQTAEKFDNVKVFDVLGRLVVVVDEQSEMIDLNHLEKGQYFLLFENDGNSLARKRVTIQ